MAARSTFTTQDEISAIKGLGSFHNTVAGKLPVSRKKLLKGYLDAAKLRTVMGDWGEVDRKKVIKFAQDELKREQ